jgi:hypothetical protein
VVVIRFFPDEFVKNFDVSTVETCSVSPSLIPLAVGKTTYLIDRNALLSRANHIGTDIVLKLVQELGLIRLESPGQIIERHGDSKRSLDRSPFIRLVGMWDAKTDYEEIFIG